MIAYLLFSIVFYCIYFLSTRKYNYWKKKKVPHLKQTPLLGNFERYLLQQEALAITQQKICQKYPKEPYVGAYYGTEPVLIVQDPEILKIILTKDFSYFNGREISSHSFKDPAGLSLFGTFGDRWKVLRQNLSPLLSTAKMKNMFHLIQKSCYEFENSLDKISKTSVNMKSLSQDFTMTCLVSCVFGFEPNILEDDSRNNPYRKVADVIFDFPISRMIKFHLRAIWPSVFYGLGLTELSNRMTFFIELVKNVLKKRDNKPSSRHDFVDLLMGWIEKGEISGDGIRSANEEARKVTIKVDDSLILAQSLVIFGAGFETTSLTITHTLYELAKNKAAQKRVQEEVDTFLLKHDRVLTYECVSELPYLEACIEEALRLYPVLGMVSREVMEDYTLPTGLRLEKHLRIHIPVYHLHRQSVHFPDPEEFRPERFLGDAKKEVNPYVFMPFGQGPRICLGMRFGKMKMFAGLMTILKKYQVDLAEGMSSTLHLHPRAFGMVTGDINLKLTPRTGWETRVFVK